MNLNGLGAIGVYSRKVVGQVARSVGKSNVYTRQLASANKPLIESSSVDILKTFKQVLSKKNWTKFLNEELPGIKKFKNLGPTQLENMAAQEFGAKFSAKTWKEYIQGIIHNPQTGLTQNSNCLDFVRKVLSKG